MLVGSLTYVLFDGIVKSAYSTVFIVDIWIFVRGNFDLIFSVYVNGRSCLACLVLNYSIFTVYFIVNIVQNV